jgi:hypothetical protein
MNRPLIIFWELLLLTASVLVFRGLWHLLDRVPWLNQPVWLWVSLGAGLGISSVALYFLNRAVNDARKTPAARLATKELPAPPKS